MQENHQNLDYPYPEWTMSRGTLQVVDTVLLAALGRAWERMRDLLPANRPESGNWTFTPEELRSSRLGQALLTIADYADGGSVPVEKVQRAMKRVSRMLYGDVLSNGFTLPAHFDTTELGEFFQSATARMYRHEDLMTPAQAYRFLGISRQSLYDRLKDGKLTAIHRHDELRFLRTEIEAWKQERQQRQRPSKREQ
jgi:predicted DNA-binding transcriptional regulator AlpA